VQPDHPERASLSAEIGSYWFGVALSFGPLANRIGINASLVYQVTGLCVVLLSATQAERRRRSEPIGQDSQGLVARMTDPAAHSNVIVLVIVGMAETPSVADDRLLAANRTSPRQKIQRGYPGLMLSSASGSATKIITAGVKAAADRPCQASI
jgi:hypothetical protein